MPQKQSIIKVVRSFDILLNGVAVSRASESVMLSVVCTEVRADWKWQKDSGLHVSNFLKALSRSDSNPNCNNKSSNRLDYKHCLSFAVSFFSLVLEVTWNSYQNVL